MSYKLPTRSLVKNDAQSMVERSSVPRSKFITSFTHNTTFDAGLLVPCFWEDVLPGDNLKIDMTAYVRMATPLFPMFDNQNVSTFFFFVPYRLLWENWAKFMGEQKRPNDSINYTVPVVTTQPGDRGFMVGTLGDYFGLPTRQLSGNNTISVNELPFRAYALIYNEWFRDQNVQNPIHFADGDGSNPGYAIMAPARRNKMHDYFTSLLPWPQKFTPPVVPLSGTLPVQGIGFAGGQQYNTQSPLVYQSGGTSRVYDRFTAVPDYGTMYVDAEIINNQNYPQIFVDLAGSAGVQLNALRQSWMIQQLLERDARGGTRYTELLLSHFDVRNPDYRLQRPEYIGGGSSPLQLTPIAQTAPTPSAPLGALGGAATSVGNHQASFAATEHGIILGLINVQSELSYQQGLHRYWTRQTRYDFYWPSLAHLGEQAVLSKELYCLGDEQSVGVNGDESVLGYQERWHEYRSRYSMVTGKFRSTALGTLDAWHLSQFFETRPVLSETFLADNPPMARVLAAGNQAAQQHYLANMLFRCEYVRPLPVHGTPATLGRF